MGVKKTSEKCVELIKINESCLPQGYQNLECLNTFIHATSSCEQLQALKQCIKFMNDNRSSPPDGILFENIIKVLVLAMVTTHSRNQSRMAISSALQMVAEEFHSKIKHAIAEQIVQIMSNSSNINDLRNGIDNISALINNFKLGEAVMVSLFSAVLLFIKRALETFYKATREAEGEEAASKYMHHCHSTIQICNKLIQKVIQHQRLEHNDSEEMSCLFHGDDCRHLINISEMMWNILSQVFLLDCQSACGIGVPLIVKTLYGAHCIPQMLHLLEATGQEVQTGGHNVSMVIRELCVSSQFCVINGLLAVFNTEELLMDISDKCLLTDVIGPYVIQLTHCEADSNAKLMASRTLVLFTNKACECLCNNCGRHKVILNSQAVLMKQIVDYVWNHWQDPVDTIRHQTKLIFQNTIQAYLLSTGEDPRTSPFIEDMVKSLLNLNLHTKGRYEPLCVLVQHMGAQKLLDITPQLPQELLMAMTEQVLAPSVSQLYEKLFISHRQEMSYHSKQASLESTDEKKTDFNSSGLLKSNYSALSVIRSKTSGESNCELAKDASEQCKVECNWLRIWVDPVLSTLCRGSKAQNKSITEYIIPNLLKCFPDTLSYIINMLSSNTNTCDRSRSLGVLVMCLSQAKHHGLFESNRSQSPVVLSKIIGKEKLVQALCDGHDQVRLDTFALLCESHKTTEVLKMEDIDLIKLFLTFNLDSQSPAFRQQLTSLIKKLTVRLRDGGNTLLRACNSNKSNEDLSSKESVLMSYKTFLQWLCGHLFKQLHPLSSFPRRTTALSILGVIVNVFGASQDKESDSRVFHFIDVINPIRVQTLVDCLTDTFEQNKLEAFKILSALPSHHLLIQEPDTVSVLLEAALDLIHSTRPQDCNTAAYLLKLLVQVPETALLLKQKRKQLKSDDNEELVSARYQVVCLLLDELEDELSVALKSLLHAAATRPLYPALHCLRYVLCDVDLRQLSGSTAWQQVITTSIELCFRIASVVSPVVSNSSPEGNIPADTLHALGPGLVLDAVVQSEKDQQLLQCASDSVAKVAHMPEYLVVCCWRSIKEVSLLLGQLTQRAPLVGLESSGRGHLEVKQLLSVGDYFIKQLTEARHRGAFELAYAGFVKMAHMLWRCPLPVVHKLPEQWLTVILDTVSDNDPSNILCATRRSAGVPFYIRALVSTEPATRGRQCFKRVMSRLLELAIPQNGQYPNQENLPQIHALNILRALYQETALGDDVFPFIADGLKAAVLGYSSKLWSIRNSSTLLFSALITRIFGVKRTKNELSKKNCMTGRVFFHRFPSLHRFLLERLKKATSDMGSTSGTFSALHPNLYPILLVLGRLFPSVIEGADVAYDLRAFIGPVISCAQSSVYKIRVMAARALCPLVAKDDILQTIRQLGNNLPKHEHSMPQNTIHGLLLQIEHLLQSVGDLPLHLQAPSLELVCEKLIPCQWLLSGRNPSFLTRTAYLNIIDKLTLMLQHPLLPKLGTPQPGYVLLTFKSELDLALSEELSPYIHVPGAVHFYESVAKYLVRLVMTTGDELMNAESVILTSLNSDLYEVRLRVLELIAEGKDYLSDGGNDVADYTDSKSNHNNKEENEDNCQGAIVVTSRRSQRFHEIIRNSQKLFTQLVTMVMGKELHADCLVKILDVFCIHKQTSILPWTSDTTTHTLDEILEKLFHDFMTHSRDELRCSTLKLTALIIPQLINEIFQRNVDLVSRWIDFLDEGSSAESSVDMRMSVAKTLVHTSETVLYFSEDLSLKSWVIILRLLHDEDDVVRQQIAQVVHHLKHITVPADITLYPPVALMIVLQAMTTAHWGLDCLDQLLTCIQSDVELDLFSDDDDIRLFDKGEMNTYRDQIHFIGLIAKHLSDIMSEDNTTSSDPLAHIYQNLVPLPGTSQSRPLNDSIRKFLQTKLGNLLVDLHKALDEMPEITLELSLTNQSLYQDTVLKLWRLSLTICVIRKLIHLDRTQDDQSKQCLTALNTKFKFQFQLTQILADTF